VCLNCVGKDSAECRANGRYVECEVDEICATTVRRNGISIVSVIKRCKQMEACLNEEKQVLTSRISHFDHSIHILHVYTITYIRYIYILCFSMEGTVSILANQIHRVWNIMEFFNEAAKIM